MDRAGQKQAITRYGWNAFCMAVAAFATVGALYAAVWLGEWHALVNHRFDDLEKRLGGVETEIREVRGEIREMRSEMREMRESIRIIEESLARIEKRLAE